MNFAVADKTIVHLYHLLNGNVKNEQYIQENFVDIDPLLLNSINFRQVQRQGTQTQLTTREIMDSLQRITEVQLKDTQYQEQGIQKKFHTVIVTFKFGTETFLECKVASGNMYNIPGHGQQFSPVTGNFGIDYTHTQSIGDNFEAHSTVMPLFARGLNETTKNEHFALNCAKHLANHIAYLVHRTKLEFSSKPDGPSDSSRFYERTGPRQIDGPSAIPDDSTSPNSDPDVNQQYKAISRLVNILAQLHENIH